MFAPDHPSFGRSATPGWLEDIADLAYFYLDVLKGLKLGRVHVIGHSMGGWIALEMAVRSTALIASLTLISSAGIRLRGRPAEDIFMMDRNDLIRARYADPALAEREINAALTPEQETQALADRIAAARLCWQPRLFNPKLGKWLHRIDVPTHVIWSDSDRIIAADYAKAFGDLIAGARVTTIPNAGHVPHVERAELVAEAVTGFAA